MSRHHYTSTCLTAAQLSDALGGKKTGNSYSCRCPAHEDRKPSFSISDGKNGRPVFYCHAGCSQEAIKVALKARGILLSGVSRSFIESSKANYRAAEGATSNRNQKFASEIWARSRPINGTLAETYLESRGISEKSISDLRFHENLQHFDGFLYPAMVGRVADPITDKFLGVHRTFLDKSGKSKASVEKPKLMLGPCNGGVVKLRDVIDKVMIGEGIETCLSAMQVTNIPAWAVLSTSGMKALKLPASVTTVYILADGDDAGEEAAIFCAKRLSTEERHVRIARPPRGCDFNDILLRKNITTYKEHK